MSKTIRIIGLPMDLGQARRGVDMGPSALRYAGVKARLTRLGYTVDDAGNIDTPDRNSLPESGGLAYLPAVVEVCQAAYEAGRQALADGCVPLFFGGDHSISNGTIGGVSHDEPVGVIWVDAHGDFNTPDSSPSGNLHGMPLATLMGHGAVEWRNVGRAGPKLRPENTLLIGIRDLDLEERTLLKQSGAAVYTMREIDERGMSTVVQEGLARLGHLSRLHVSLDMDSLDPREAPGVGTPVPGGLTYREAHLLMEMLADDGRVGSVDVVEVNPILDTYNHTAEIAVELLASLFGQSIF